MACQEFSSLIIRAYQGFVQIRPGENVSHAKAQKRQGFLIILCVLASLREILAGFKKIMLFQRYMQESELSLGD